MRVMIKKSFDKFELMLQQDYYGLKTLSYIKAYGMGYDFLRFYAVQEGLATGSVMLFNRSAVIGGSLLDFDELSDFIQMSSPLTVECPTAGAERLELTGYSAVKRTLFNMCPDPDFKENEVVERLETPPSLEAVFKVLEQSFPKIEFDLWYTDTSHRIRHGVSRLFLYDNCSCAAIDFALEGKAFISGVATLPEERGRGRAGDLLRYIAALLKRNGFEGYLWATDETADFYRKLGFSAVDEDYMFVSDEE